jgi:protein-tyrosine phosphatase
MRRTPASAGVSFAIKLGFRARTAENALLQRISEFPIKQRLSSWRRLAYAFRIRVSSVAALAAARRASRERVQRIRARRILVVCYGNIYRSAFVGALLRDQLGPTTDVRSTGFHSVGGRSSPERHIVACKRYGVSLEDHRSNVITAEDLKRADLIVIMDRHNWAALKRMGVDEQRLVWLGSFAPGRVEIADPYTRSDDEAAQLVARMYAATKRLIELIKDPAQRR